MTRQGETLAGTWEERTFNASGEARGRVAGDKMSLFDCPVAMLLTFLGRTHVGDYGWPAGGSIALARAIERRFVELGGEIRYEARVQSIIVENGRAVGVRLS